MKKIVLITILLFPFVAYAQNTEKVAVYMRDFRIVTNYGKERAKPFWVNVTCDSATTIFINEQRNGVSINVVHDSVAMSAFVEKDVFSKSDSVIVRLRANVFSGENVLVMTSLSNSIVSGSILNTATVPHHEIIFYYDNPKTYKKILRKNHACRRK